MLVSGLVRWYCTELTVHNLRYKYYGWPTGWNSGWPTGWNSGWPTGWNSGWPTGWNSGRVQEMATELSWLGYFPNCVNYFQLEYHSMSGKWPSGLQSKLQALDSIETLWMCLIFMMWILTGVPDCVLCSYRTQFTFTIQLLWCSSLMSCHHAVFFSLYCYLEVNTLLNGFADCRM